MRKYRNVQWQGAYPVLKEYFMADPRYEISRNISRFTDVWGYSSDPGNPGRLWDNLCETLLVIEESVLYIDLP